MAGRFWLALTGLLVAWALMSGCVDDEDKVAPPIIVGPGPSPASCLEDLVLAYVDRSESEYRELFFDDFIFVFTPEDVSQDPSIPQSWGLADELQSASNLFRSEFVDGIELAFTQSLADSAFDEFPGAWKVDVTEVELQVHIHTEDEEPLTLKVSDGWGRFYFKEDPEETDAYGRPLWRIWRWEDQPAGPKARSEDLTWGTIKHDFF